MDKLGADAIVRKLPEVYQNPKSWVVTGTQGMFVYSRGAVEEKQTVGETLSGATKLILQTLVRMVLGI
jgi:hypothetical protein